MRCGDLRPRARAHRTAPRSESAGVVVRPGPAALIHAQDKAIMRDRLTALGAPCPISRVVADEVALIAFGDELGWPIVAKASRGGYDGKGVWRLDSAAEAGEPFARLTDGVQIIGEEFVDFTRELSASGRPLTVRAGGRIPDLGIRPAKRHLCGNHHACAWSGG